MMVIRKVKNIGHLILAIIACVWYGFPGRKLTVVGVTGTDGKTTTTHLIYHCLVKNGIKVSMMSSVYAKLGNTVYDTGFHVTSPNPFFVQKSLKKAYTEGSTHMVLEVTSHGLDQYRVWGIPFKVSVITNITHEHLDYHKTYQRYVKAKARILNNSNYAVLNRDDKSYKLLLSFIKNDQKPQKIVSFGMLKGDVVQKEANLTTKLQGSYNLYNCLTAYSVCTLLGLQKSDIKKAIASFNGVTGRFEIIQNKNRPTVIIDFAHTPNALEQVLSTVSDMNYKRIIHVFGCAGLRDFQKRPLMGEISARYSNVTVITEEDYRTESIDKINKAIIQGIGKGTKYNKDFENYTVIPNRKKAISYAIAQAGTEDVVVLTGKGHEKSLCRGREEMGWDEKDTVNNILNIK